MRTTIAEEINTKLKKAELTTCDRLIGKLFVFEAERGSHQFQLCGTITGIGISDEGGLELFVSIPELWGKKLKSIIFSESKKHWNACACLDVDIPPEEFEQRGDEALSDKFLYGDFELF